MKKNEKTTSLGTDDITTARTGRRSAMLMIGAVVTAVATQACNTGCTDSDSGPLRDPAGAGIHCRSGCTDSDSGSSADLPGHGRRC
jgi:hypothetical protein